jgi:hypothetical protein
VNKSKVWYAVSLSVVLVTSMFFQVQQLNTISHHQYNVYGQEIEIVRYEGEPVVINLNSSAPSGRNVTYTWELIGEKEVAFNLTNSNKTASFNSPSVDTVTQIVIRVTASSGLSKTVKDIVVIVLPDKAPIADAGPNQNITTQEICSPQNSSNPLISPVILNGSKSSDDRKDSLVYQWTQIAGDIKLNLTNPTNATTSFEINGLCDISETMDFIFELMVTDSSKQNATGLTRLTINPEDPLSLDFDIK